MSTCSDKVTFIIGMALAVSAATAAPRCDWAGKVGGKSIWLSTEGIGTATALPVLWGGSSPVPSALTRSADGRVTLTKSYSHPDHPDWAWTRTLSFVPSAGDSMECVFFETRANRPGKDVTATGTVSRLPPLPARPDLAAVRYGEPIDILKDGLNGFDVLDNGRASQWRFADGVLENGGSGANIRTKRGDFTDFRISYDVRVDKDCNSGVYLRGIYELQVSDSFGKPVDSHNMAALYGRIAPSVPAEKPAGEWQHVEAILYRRHLTVTLNGVRIIDNEPIRGITGGALSTDESAPGPIGLQGDHKGGAYRNLILTPVVRERVLVVCAHPDDSIALAGTMFMMRDIFDIHIADLTRGDAKFDRAKGVEPGSKAAIRTKEEESAAALVGARVHWLDFLDGSLYATPEACRAVEDLIREVKPRAIFAMWPIDRHLDHAMAGTIVLKAAKAAGFDGEFYYYEEVYGSKGFVPQHYVDITGQIGEKQRFVRCYACQNPGDSMNRVEVDGARGRGYQTMYVPGREYAECFAPLAGFRTQGRRCIFNEMPRAD